MQKVYLCMPGNGIQVYFTAENAESAIEYGKCISYDLNSKWCTVYETVYTVEYSGRRRYDYYQPMTTLLFTNVNF